MAPKIRSPKILRWTITRWNPKCLQKKIYQETCALEKVGGHREGPKRWLSGHWKPKCSYYIASFPSFWSVPCTDTSCPLACVLGCRGTSSHLKSPSSWQGVSNRSPLLILVRWASCQNIRLGIRLDSAEMTSTPARCQTLPLGDGIPSRWMSGSCHCFFPFECSHDVTGANSIRKCWTGLRAPRTCWMLKMGRSHSFPTFGWHIGHFWSLLSTKVCRNP